MAHAPAFSNIYMFPVCSRETVIRIDGVPHILEVIFCRCSYAAVFMQTSYGTLRVGIYDIFFLRLVAIFFQFPSYAHSIDLPHEGAKMHGKKVENFPQGWGNFLCENQNFESKTRLFLNP